MNVLRARTLTWLLAGLALLSLCGCVDRGRAGLTRALLGRGKLAVAGSSDLLSLRADGSSLGPVSAWPAVQRALSGDDPEALVSALTRAQLRGLVLDSAALAAGGSATCVASQLSRYAHVPGLQGVFLSPYASLYVLDPLHDWPLALRTGLAEVARRLLSGAAAPRMASFPERVRQVEPVEVMVLLRSGTQARLWRSARGSSFARALLTATEVARKRWIEREQAMGGPLDQRLPHMDVEVSLLQDDGELGVRDSSFIDRVVTPVHGVAYEHKGAWRYLLPDDTHKHAEAASQAYLRLVEDDGLPDSSVKSDELRLYRMTVQPVGVSDAPLPAGAHPPAPHDAISDVANPAEVLGR
ncbi:MAG TPA: hypothetical protein VF331_07700 [Polyangiales bacterium]